MESLPAPPLKRGDLGDYGDPQCNFKCNLIVSCKCVLVTRRDRGRPEVTKGLSDRLVVG